ncbi:MAG: AsmA-like C-terminal domain-containing protein [Rhizomicrobium sp.]
MRIRRHHLHHVSLATVAVIAIALFFVAGVVLRLAMGPVSLGPFSERLRSSVLYALPGLAIRYDDAALEWSHDEGRVNLIIVGARVFDSKNHIVAQAPKAEIGLGAAALVSGQIEVRRIALVGVQLNLVRTKDGVLHLGVERNKTSGDVLQRIRDAIEKSGSGASSLERFAVTQARLAFYDERQNLFLVAPKASVEIANEPYKGVSRLTAHVNADVEVAGRPAHLVASIRLPQGNASLTGDLSVTGLELTALARDSKKFSFLRPFNLQTDLTATFTVEHGTTLSSADVGLRARGVIGGFGSPLKINELQFLGKYDGVTKRLLIDDATLKGENIEIHARGTANLAFLQDGSLSNAKFEIESDRMALTMPDAFQRGLSLGGLSVRGSYTTSNQTFLFDEVLLGHAPLTGKLKGRVILAQNAAPGIDFDGSIDALAVRDLIKLWPIHVSEGARTWLAGHVLSGRLGPISVMTRIKPGALNSAALPDEALNVSFPIADMSVDYLDGMSPLAHASGRAILSGDTFRTEVASGRVGALAVTKATVAIPRLHEHGTTGEISATLKGQVHDLLNELDHKPLQYPTKFHIKPDEAAGNVVASGDFRIPMIKDVGIDRIPIRVQAATSGLAVSLGPRTKLADGTIRFDVDNDHLHAMGTINYGSIPLTAEWTESFKATSPITTHINIRGSFDERARAAFKVNLSDLLTGTLGVSAQLAGRQGEIRTAEGTIDLTPATIFMSPISYMKAAGVPASAQVTAGLNAAGNISTADLHASGAGLNVQGRLTFSPDGNLLRADLPTFRAGPNNDFALALSQVPSNGLDITVRGSSADGSAAGRQNSPGSNASKESTTPYHIVARLNRFVLKENTVLSPFNLDATTTGSRVQVLSLTTGMSGGDSVTAQITPVADGRRLTVTATDAGALVKGVFGLNDISGGKLSINGHMPPMNAPKSAPDYSGTLTIRDFKIENQPFFARLFSAGSLGGLLDLMRGSGIVIDKLEMPFSAKDDVINIRDAHASGPSVGLSGDGYVDRRGHRLELRGAVAPIYGLNRILGALPIVGNVLVSKPGEGIIGVTYYASGNLDEPNISVNPLSLLAPGILRRIFEGKVPTVPEPADKTAPAPATTPH